MIEIGSRPGQLTLAPTARGAAGQWQVGMLLKALVRQEGGRTMLEIAGQRFEPRTTLPLRSGEQLQLRVVQTQPPILQIVSQPTARAPLLAAAWRSALPHQPNLAPLLQTLKPTAQAPLPPPLRGALRTLQAQLPPAAEAQNPRTLPQLLGRSGTSLEANLARLPLAAAGPYLQQDFKAGLLRLFGQLQSVERLAAGANQERAGMEELQTRQLGEQVQRALGRIQTLQLHNAGSERLDLLFELPLRLGEQIELVRLRIREEDAQAERDGEPQRALQVQLGFAFEDIGALHAAARLVGTRLNATWWAERAGTAEMLRAALPDWNQHLTQLGFEITALACHHGAPPAGVSDFEPAPMRGMLDEEA